MKGAAILILMCMAGPALAQEPVGCDKFKWPIDKERAMLNAPAITRLASGGTFSIALPAAAAVILVPIAAAKLPMPPEHQPKSPDTFAGFITIAAPAQAGVYTLTLSAEGWIDVVQDGRLVKSQSFSGATGCEGVRKSVKFDLATKPFIVQFSSVRGDSIRVAITGD